MTRATYEATWKRAFDEAIELVVDLGQAADEDAVLPYIREVPACAGTPVSCVRTMAVDDVERAHDTLYIHRYAHRGCGSLVPQMFHRQLEQVLARDDAATADCDDRIFKSWRPLGEAFGAAQK